MIYHTNSLRTKNLDFREFDSGRILILRGGILRSIGEAKISADRERGTTTVSFQMLNIGDHTNPPHPHKSD